MMNNLLLRKDMCHWSRGMQIRSDNNFFNTLFTNTGSSVQNNYFAYQSWGKNVWRKTLSLCNLCRLCNPHHPPPQKKKMRKMFENSVRRKWMLTKGVLWCSLQTSSCISNNDCMQLLHAVLVILLHLSDLAYSTVWFLGVSFFNQENLIIIY